MAFEDFDVKIDDQKKKEVAVSEKDPEGVKLLKFQIQSAQEELATARRELAKPFDNSGINYQSRIAAHSRAARAERNLESLRKDFAIVNLALENKARESTETKRVEASPAEISLPRLAESQTKEALETPEKKSDKLSKNEDKVKELTLDQAKDFENNLESSEFLGKIWDEAIVPNYNEISRFKLEIFGFTPHQAELIIARLFLAGMISEKEQNPAFIGPSGPGQDRLGVKNIQQRSLEYTLKEEYVGKKWTEIPHPVGNPLPPDEVASAVEVGKKENKSAVISKSRKSFFDRSKNFFSGLFIKMPELKVDSKELPTLKPNVRVINPETKPDLKRLSKIEILENEPMMNPEEVVSTLKSAPKPAGEQEAVLASGKAFTEETMKDPHIVAALEFNKELSDLLKYIQETIKNPEAVRTLLEKELKQPKMREIINRMNPNAVGNILLNAMLDSSKEISTATRTGIAIYLKDRGYPVSLDTTRKFAKFPTPFGREKLRGQR